MVNSAEFQNVMKDARKPKTFEEQNFVIQDRVAKLRIRAYTWKLKTILLNWKQKFLFTKFLQNVKHKSYFRKFLEEISKIDCENPETKISLKYQHGDYL